MHFYEQNFFFIAQFVAALLTTKHNQEKLGPKHQIITINKQKCTKLCSR